MDSNSKDQASAEVGIAVGSLLWNTLYIDNFVKTYCQKGGFENTSEEEVEEIVVKSIIFASIALMKTSKINKFDKKEMKKWFSEKIENIDKDVDIVLAPLKIQPVPPLDDGKLN